MIKDWVSRTYANDAVGTNELDEVVGHGALGVALTISLDVAEITDMASLIGGSTVGLAVRVDYMHLSALIIAAMSPLGSKLTVRASGGAAVGVVTEGVDVEAALRVGVVSGNVPRDGGGGVLVGLLEGHGAGDLGVTTEDADCMLESSVSDD
jgi:hypothetical protein